MLKNSWVAIGALCVAILGGCGGGTTTTGHGGNNGTGGHAAHDGGTDAKGDHPVTTGSGGHGGAGGADAAICHPGASKGVGQTCGCADECTSGFCADGFCCNKACTDGCLTCGEPGSEGTCLSRTNGTKPRTAAACPTSAVSTCGLDGLCDGTGKCRDYPTGSICTPGTCQGAALIGVGVCDGSGQCRPGPTMICAPFQCDPTKGACYDSCSSKAQCSDDHACDATGSCGKRMPGAKCAKNDDCLSGFCADGVCCNSACTGACVSCNLPDRPGVCWPIDMGAADPHSVCKDQGTATCGQTGQCDGIGGCSMYALGTLCTQATCTGNKLNTSGICDGLGSCKPPGLQTCSPFKCLDNACTIFCNADSDCDTGISCVGHSCGPKQNGQVCKAGTECKSGQCIDGYCCENACTGACRSCGLPGSQGKCTMIAAGNADTRLTCKDTGAAGCGTNGKCDGAGACQQYLKGVTCKSESCASNIYTPQSTCDGAGKCVTPNTLACAPYVCNGSKCFNSCATDTQCLTPNRCASNSCGKSGPGASCTSSSQCKSGFCAQGVCCNSACGGACQSCNLSGSLGTCTNVATGTADPAGMCKDLGAASCGTNGKCQAGACQKYASGTTCAAATCPAGSVTFTGKSTCDGAGTCVTPKATSCSPFVCGAGACKAACGANSDCNPPYQCVNSSCGLKELGGACSADADCKSTHCSQGVCCNQACTGTCKSCNVSSVLAGTCSNVPNNQPDPSSTCTDKGPASCGTTGVCDGMGACQKYAAGTQCAGSTCPAGSTTLTKPKTCDGAGTCTAPTPATSSCGQYACDGTKCNTTCTANSQCKPGTVCDLSSGHCGTFAALGESCTTTADCFSGMGLACVDGVCCSAGSCPACQSCSGTGPAGTCSPKPKNATDTGCGSTIVNSSQCGKTNTCDGAGKCLNSSAQCKAASCTGSMLTMASFCDPTSAASTCPAGAQSSCGKYVCASSSTCKTMCMTSDDCTSSSDTCNSTGMCQSGGSIGDSCSSTKPCAQGTCVDTVCCSTACSGACHTCNGTTPGTCTVTTGATCGSAAMCSGGTATSAGMCDSTGSCQVTTTHCGEYVCGDTTCKTSCNGKNDCVSGDYCDGSGKCQPKKGPGKSCGATDECAAGVCGAENVCCDTKCDGMCMTCKSSSAPGICTPDTTSPGCVVTPPADAGM